MQLGSEESLQQAIAFMVLDRSERMTYTSSQPASKLGGYMYQTFMVHQSSPQYSTNIYVSHELHYLPSCLKSLLPNLPLTNARLSLLIAFVSSTTSTYTIILIPFGPISNTNVPDFVADLHPFLTAGRDRANLAQGPVCQARNNETGEEVDIVDVFGTHWHRLPNGANKSDNVDEDTADIRRVSAPVEAKSEVIRSRFLGGVEVLDLVEAATDDVVVADDDTCNRGKEDGVGG